MNMSMHETVLLHEAVEALNVRADGVYVDGTFGRGGHAREIIKTLNDDGRYIGFDKDLTAIESAERVFAGKLGCEVCHSGFKDMKQQLESMGLLGKVDGILLDLGVSSPQLDDADRGFSFLRDGPLDMRMDQSRGMTAAEWIASFEKGELKKVLRDFGEEKFAGLIEAKVLERREKAAFVTTLDLANFIADVIPTKAHEKGKHPATRSFQAIRIFINGELQELENLLEDVVDILAVGGRLAIISFHSLEDRMVKRFIRAQEKGPQLPRNIPVMEIHRVPHLKSVGKAVKAGAAEVEANVRSRSAIMRVAEKVAA